MLDVVLRIGKLRLGSRKLGRQVVPLRLQLPARSARLAQVGIQRLALGCTGVGKMVLGGCSCRVASCDWHKTKSCTPNWP